MDMFGPPDGALLSIGIFSAFSSFASESASPLVARMDTPEELGELGK